MIGEIGLNTTRREEMLDITAELQGIVSKNGIKEGIIAVFNPHTTGAVTINEGADPAVQYDILEALKKQYPFNKKYKHTEGNADAHIKSALIGSDRVIPIKNSRLALGQWQRVFFCEFDGPRSRKITFIIIPS